MTGAGLKNALASRFVAVPAVLAVLIAAWNVYIAFHDDGIVAGAVRDAAGAPVAGATVILYDRNFVTYRETQRTRSGADGRFRFEAFRSHLGQVEAETADGRHSERQPFRLWFRSQNIEVAPLVVQGQPTRS
jgi:hypothetical protein